MLKQKDLQTIEKKRIESFKDFVIDCVKIEVEVLPRIKQCYNEVESSARSIDAEQVRDYLSCFLSPISTIY